MTCYGIAAFATSSLAVRAESVLAADGLAVRLIPTPRHLHSGCAVALRFLWDDAERVRELLCNAGVPSNHLGRL